VPFGVVVAIGPIARFTAAVVMLVTLSQAEVWLEIVTDDVSAAAKRFSKAGVVQCDDIERLPEGFQGFWISNPASIVHIVAKPGY